MLVSKTLETAEGNVKFEGELEEKELDLVIKIGLNYLFQMGALPFITKEMGTVKTIDDQLEETPEQ